MSEAIRSVLQESPDARLVPFRLVQEAIREIDDRLKKVEHGLTSRAAGAAGVSMPSRGLSSRDAEEDGLNPRA